MNVDYKSTSVNPVFVPFSEELLAEAGSFGELVPFQLEYQCLRLKDGTYDFTTCQPLALLRRAQIAA